MKKHFLLLAFAAICSLSVMGQTVTAGWDGYSKNNLPSNGNAKDNTITLSTNLSTGGYSLGGRSTNAYNYEYANSDNYIDITTPDNMEITSVTAYIIYLGDNNSIAIQFCSESPFSSADLGSETLTGSTIQNQESPCSPTIPSGTRSARIHRANTGWGPYLYAVSVTAEPAAAPVGPVDPKITFNNGTYYLGTSGLDLSTLFSSKNKESAVSYEIKSDGGTGATLTGSILTATTAGTVVVTASQEAVDGKYNAQSVDATITVATAPVHDYATTADFYAEAAKTSPMDVYQFMSSHYYTLSPNTAHWDAQRTFDGGLGLSNGKVYTFSFWVQANKKVTIKVGILNGDGSDQTATVTQKDIYGNQIAEATISRESTTDYTTAQETQFVITTKAEQTWSWSRIQQINIKALKYTLTLKAGEGTGDDVVEQKSENETYTLNKPDGFVKAGYHVKEWSDGTTTYAAGTTFIMPAKNVTLTAIWEEDSDVEYTVTYANGGGEWVAEPTEGNHKAGDTFTLPASSVVTYDGYQFAGWNDGANTFDAEATYTMPAKAVTLTAMWNQLYTVTYNAGDVTYSGTLPTKEPQIEGASFKVAAGIKCQGYAFKGWKAGATTYQPNDDFTMPASAVEFTAQWEEKIVSPVTNFTATGIHKDVTLTWQMPATSKRIPVDLSSTTKREGQGGNFTVLSKESNLATISYNATGDWAYIYVHVPLGQTLTNFETITLDYKGNGSSAAVCYPYGGLEGYKWYNTECNFGNTDWQTMSSTPTTALHFGGTYTHTIDAIGFAISGGNAPAGVVSFRNVILTLSEGEWIEGMKLLRKAGSAPSGPTDAEAEVLVSEGLVAGYQDIVPVTVDEVTYYYALYTYDEEENYSVAATASYTFVPQQEYTVTYAAGGEDVIGEVPVDEMPKVEGTKFNLLAPGSLQKPYCQFNGWKSSANNEVYTAGQEYIMPADNVTFTAQWKSYDHIPQVSTLDYSNLTATNSTLPLVSTDGGTCIDLTKGDSDPNFYADWKVFIKPGIYTVSYRAGTDEAGWRVRLYLYDAANMSTPIKSASDSWHNKGYETVVYNWDLTNLDENKLYIVRAENDYTGSHLRVHYINFEFVQSTPTAGFATPSKILVLNETFTQTVTTNSDGAITYSSSAPAVAEVNETTGEVTAVAKGTATITATIAETEAFKGATATYTVTVTKPMPTASFAITQKDLYVGDKFTQEVTTTSTGAVTYSSNNNAVTVNASTGEVTAVAPGSATITANIAETETSEATSATYSITVMKSTGPIYLEPGENRIGAILNTLEDGDIIVFRDGEFTETVDRVFNVSVTLRADEGANPVLNSSGYLKTMKSITVDGLTINSTNGSYAFYLQGSSTDNAIFRNSTINMKSSGNTIYPATALNSFIIDNCLIKTGGSQGLYLQQAISETSITNTTIQGATYSAIYLSGSARPTTINHCTFYNNPSTGSYVIHAYGFNSSQLTISNCVMYNQSTGAAYGIFGQSGNNATVTNCMIYNCGTATINTNNTNLMTVDPQLVVDENGMYYRPNSPIVGAATDGSNLGDPRWKIYYITITDQDADDALLESYNGKKANVEVIRPLTAGMTNSICLPFALNREQINTAFGTDAEVWALTSSTLSANNMTLDIEFEQVEEMAAGKPYLIQPGEGYDRDVNPIFYGVTVSTDLAPVVQDNLDFIGTVQKSFVSVGYKDHLFVGADNMVYYPSGSGDLNGMRAYFKIKYHAGDIPAGVSARMILGKTTPTELRTPKATDSVRKVMKEGRIYIIRNGVVNDMFGNTVK